MSTKKQKEKKVVIVPRGKQILVRVDDEQSRVNEYGIVIPDEVEQERKAQGTVEAVGPEIKDVKKGDRVIYGAYAGESIKTRESEKQIDYKILEDADVIAFIR